MGQSQWISTSIKSPPSPGVLENESSSSSSTATLVQHPHTASETRTFLQESSLRHRTSVSSASISDPMARQETMEPAEEKKKKSGETAAAGRQHHRDSEDRRTSPEKRSVPAAAACKSLRSRRRRRSLSLCESFSDGESTDGEFNTNGLLACDPRSRPPRSRSQQPVIIVIRPLDSPFSGLQPFPVCFLCRSGRLLDVCTH